MTEPKDVLVQLATPIVKDAYSDTVSGALREVGKIGVDALKTFRLALFPLQFAGALQDRLASYIDRAVRSVPPERRMAPVESLALQITDRLRLQEDGSAITEMYIKLLARGVDRERVGEAHPAFVQLVGQLAPDEALLIEQLAALDFAAYLKPNIRNAAPVALNERISLANHHFLGPAHGSVVLDIALRPEELAQPELMFTYVEHLISLGLVVYTNDHPHADLQEGMKRMAVGCWFVQLNQFGRLFHRACLGRDEV